jgi:hypothetical protein
MATIGPVVRPERGLGAVQAGEQWEHAGQGPRCCVGICPGPVLAGQDVRAFICLRGPEYASPARPDRSKATRWPRYWPRPSPQGAPGYCGAGEQDALVGNGAHGTRPELTRTMHERQVSPRPVGREQVGLVDPLLGRGGLVRRVYPHPWNQRERALLPASPDPQAQNRTPRLPGWAVQRPVKTIGQIGKDRCPFAHGWRWPRGEVGRQVEHALNISRERAVSASQPPQ